MQNESSEFSLLSSSYFLPELVKQPGKAYQRLVAISSISDILHGTFDRLNQEDSDSIRIDSFIVAHYKYSNLCPQKEQYIKSEIQFSDKKKM